MFGDSNRHLISYYKLSNELDVAITLLVTFVQTTDLIPLKSVALIYIEVSSVPTIIIVI